MKKFTLYALSVILGIMSAKAEVLLSEDFEGLTSLEHDGWTVINDDQVGSKDVWKLSSERGAMSGLASAEAGSFSDGVKKEDWLISPEILFGENDYKLELMWGQASAAYAIDQKQYDFQIRVQVSGESDWTKVFSFLDREMVELSGVKWPWKNWTNYQSLIDLSQFRGKKIKIGFVYVKLKDGFAGNSIKIDNITVQDYKQIKEPIIDSVTKSYIFPATYLGTESHSEVLKFKNVGVGTLEVKAVKGLEGSDFYTSIEPGNVFVEKNDEYEFYIHYKPTFTGKTAANMVIETNGGSTLEISLVGEKLTVPDGYFYEGFESEAFPPVGWKVNGRGWLGSNASYSGKRSAWGTATMEEKAELISPRLDLSANKEFSVTFDFFDDYKQLVSPYPQPDNYFRVYFSSDGGSTWSMIYQNDKEFNERVRKTLSLGTPQSDNCFVKWEYYIGDFTAQYEDTEYSDVYIDDVLLPNVYGNADKPVAAVAVSPADGAVDVTNRDLKLSWEPVQFAKSYKVFLGKGPDTFDVLSGVDVGDNLSFIAPRLDYSKKYYWKVVAVNDNGETENPPVWSFTTMADQTVSEYPYFYGFETDGWSLGWSDFKDKFTDWSILEMNAFDGKKVACANGSQSDTEATLVSTEFVLPADKDMQISFFWGNDVPVGLKRDDFGVASNTSTGSDGIDVVYFDINVDGSWVNKAVLSQNCEYWLRECVDLSPYKGKTVFFRWRYVIENGYSSRGVSLDNIKIESTDGCLAFFNAEGWNVGEVNYGGSVCAKGKFSIGNGGGADLQVERVSFASDNYTATLSAGTVIAPNKVSAFDITFNAKTSVGECDDEMTIAFKNGQSIKFPVSATVLASDIAFYNFEEDEFGSLKPNGFKVIDQDRLNTFSSMAINFPNEGSPFAYVVINVLPDMADWRNVYPRSGDQVLAAFASPTDATSDWIISPMMKATSASQFRFFGKSYATDDEYNDFKPHYYTVLVSTTGTDVNDFEEVTDKEELAYSKEGKFTEYKVDLSKYAGQNVYVALKHTVNTTGYVAFFDDFYYEHFEMQQGGIGEIPDDKLVSVYPNPAVDVLNISVEALSVTITNMNGGVVAQGFGTQSVSVENLPKGIYFASVTTQSGTRTFKFIKK